MSSVVIHLADASDWPKLPLIYQAEKLGYRYIGPGHAANELAMAKELTVATD